MFPAKQRVADRLQRFDIPRPLSWGHAGWNHRERWRKHRAPGLFSCKNTTSSHYYLEQARGTQSRLRHTDHLWAKSISV